MHGEKHLQLDEGLSHLGEVQSLSEPTAGIPYAGYNLGALCAAQTSSWMASPWHPSAWILWVWVMQPWPSPAESRHIPAGSSTSHAFPSPLPCGSLWH